MSLHTVPCVGFSMFRNHYLILTNGIKFTEPGGTVAVRAERFEDQVMVTVSDDGVGMSPVQVKGLFRIDTQSSTPGTKGEPGTGLGLLLCKEFVEKHGGKVYVQSTPGKGSTFRFTLPAANRLPDVNSA